MFPSRASSVGALPISRRPLSRRPLSLAAFGLFLSAFGAGLPVDVARAQTGVSDDRVSLPDGPGSLDGVGDNASVNANMGSMSYSISLSVPAGVQGQTPSFGLSYTSQGGNGTVGMGWSMATPSIERMTSKGLPEYSSEDRFVVGGSTELVRTEDGPSPVYRARYEGGFVRYTWHERGEGDEGYWTAAYPSGLVETYGADRTGALVQSARLRSPDGVFRYLLVDSVDVFGNRISYDYQIYGAIPLLDSVGWAFGADGTPRFSVRLDYQERPDPISDARAGFNERTAHRMTDVRVFSGTALIRRFELAYEDTIESGGVSRLASVTRFGRDGGVDGKRSTMSYSRALAGVCDGTDCDAPQLSAAGNIGAGFSTGRVNLIDLSGDGLPDAVFTPASGAHRIYLGQMNAEGGFSFAAPFDSAVGDSGSFEMSSPYTQVLDFDGDGFTDLLDSLSGRVLVNTGSGDWSRIENLSAGVENLPDFAEDFELDGENELTSIRFTDIDGDKRIDVLRSDAAGTSLFRSLGAGGFESIPVEPIEAAFADDATDLADVNGDGLLDPVQLREGQLRYRLSLGRGKWTEWSTMSDMPFSLAELPSVQLEDLNGDGLDDVVLVQGGAVRFALNRNNASFAAEQTLTSAGGQPLPIADATVTVLFADMNANGSNDVVWIDDAGEVQFLDLFPVRPHLLAEINNGLGYTARVTYRSMALERALGDPADWTMPVPMPNLVVDAFSVFAQAEDPSLIREDRLRYEYAGGFYDGVEKQFRGFARATLLQEDENGTVEFRSESTYDVGDGDNRGHFAGKTIESRLFDGDTEVQESSAVYADCPVADAGDGADLIRWACMRAEVTVSKESAPASEWVTTRTETEFDGYGNITRVANLGIVDIGGNGCPACDRVAGETGAPCGAQCLGDEDYAETDYLPPSAVTAAYRTSLPQERRYFSVESGGEVKRDRLYYDGEPFVGLPLGSATRGVLIRKTVDVGGDAEPTEPLRREVDAFGNTIDEIRAGQEVAEADHLRRVYSADGRDVLRTFREAEAPDGEILTHVVDYAYSADFGTVTSTTGWYLDGIEDGEARRRFWTYDEHGRVASHIRPGNSIDAPSEVYTYELGAPYTRLITQKRSEVGGPLDIEEVVCLDGFGRTVMVSGRQADGQYLIGGYTLYNRSGDAVRSYQPYTAPSGSCSAPSEDVRFTEREFDGLGRVVRTLEPAGTDGEAPHESRVEYLPSGKRLFTADDTDETSGGFDTPTTILLDGLNRVASLERTLEGDIKETYRFEYDAFGRPSVVIGPDGRVVKEQVYDLADRVVSVRDADAGETTFVYSDSGELLSTTDGRGETIEREYDKLGRMIAAWDARRPADTRFEYYYDRHPECATNACTYGAARAVGSRSPSRLGDVVDGVGFDENGETAHYFRKIGDTVLQSDVAFDNASRIVEQRFTGGHQLTYGADPLGRLTSIGGIVDEVAFNAQGLPERMAFANGVDTAYRYDNRLNLAGISATGVVDLSVRRNRVDAIVGIDDGVNVGDLNMTATFDVDALARLIGAEYGGEELTYVVDALDRIVEKTSSRGAASTAHVGTLAYSDVMPRALENAGGVRHSLDEGGYVVERGGDVLAYDAFGRLTAVDGATSLSIDRDGVGKRTVAQVQSEERLYMGRSFEVRDGITRVRVAVGPETVAFQESASAASTLLGLTGPARAVTAADAIEATGAEQRVRLRSGAKRLLLDVAGATRFIHTDHLGSTIAISNESGEVTERLAYYPYGEVRASSAVQTDDAAFTGVDDDGTGYLDYGNRVYSPREGRWLSPDPLYVTYSSATLENPGEAFTAYAYVGNNPTTLVDVAGYDGNDNIKKAAIITADVALVAGAVAVGIAAVGVTAGALNIVGGVAGGVVSGARMARAERANMKQEYTSKGLEIPKERKALAAARVAAAAAKGAAAGFATAGISITADIVDAASNVALASDNNTLKAAGVAGKLLAGPVASLLGGELPGVADGIDTVGVVADLVADGTIDPAAIQKSGKKGLAAVKEVANAAVDKTKVAGKATVKAVGKCLNCAKKAGAKAKNVVKKKAVKAGSAVKAGAAAGAAAVRKAASK